MNFAFVTYFYAGVLFVGAVMMEYGTVKLSPLIGSDNVRFVLGVIWLLALLCAVCAIFGRPDNNKND